LDLLEISSIIILNSLSLFDEGEIRGGEMRGGEMRGGEMEEEVRIKINISIISTRVR